MCDSCNWKNYAAVAELLACDPGAQWVDVDLDDVAQWIRREEHCTERQAVMIDRIKACVWKKR